jgi:hypothetical protein
VIFCLEALAAHAYVSCISITILCFELMAKHDEDQTKEENSTNAILQCKILWLLWHLNQTFALFFAATKTQTQNGIRAPEKQIGNPAL